MTKAVRTRPGAGVWAAPQQPLYNVCVQLPGGEHLFCVRPWDRAPTAKPVSTAAWYLLAATRTLSTIPHDDVIVHLRGKKCAQFSSAHFHVQKMDLGSSTTWKTGLKVGDQFRQKLLTKPESFRGAP